MYEGKTEEMIRADILSRMPGDISTAEGSFAGVMAAGAAAEICKAYHAADGMVGMICLDEGSGPYIDLQAAEVGITRKPARRATCTMHIQGKAGTEIPHLALWYTASGIAFESVFYDSVPDSGTLDLFLTAVEPGASGNISAGALTTMGKTIPGLTSAQNDAATGGVDAESDKALLGRLMAHRARPAVSGNAYHYEEWARSVAGVGGARVLSKQDGPGTIKVVLVSPIMEPTSDEVTRAADKVIQEAKPLGPTVTVLAAGRQAVNVAATVTTKPGASKDAIREQLTNLLRAQLAQTVEAAFTQHVDCELEEITGYKVLYNFVLAALMGCEGVVDISTLTINGASSNLVVAADHAAVMGTVVVK